jgi:hypothetical protein
LGALIGWWHSCKSVDMIASWLFCVAASEADSVAISMFYVVFRQAVAASADGWRGCTPTYLSARVRYFC